MYFKIEIDEFKAGKCSNLKAYEDRKKLELIFLVFKYSWLNGGSEQIENVGKGSASFLIYDTEKDVF